MSDDGLPTDVRVVLGTDEIVRGLKHYRRIARQDLVRAEQAEDPDAFRRHAEARRDVYARLTEVAADGTPDQVVRTALEAYRELPFVTGTGPTEHVEVKGRENALENFFLMIGLEPKVRRTVRSQRVPLRPAS